MYRCGGDIEALDEPLDHGGVRELDAEPVPSDLEAKEVLGRAEILDFHLESPVFMLFMFDRNQCPSSGVDELTTRSST